MDISVIIPCYNHANYISECINSVLNQTLKPKEIIFIDDGSSDSSYEIGCDILNKSCDIKMHKEKQSNLGSHATINKGVALSSSEYVTIINSDDVYDINRFEKISKNVRRDFSWAFTGINFIGSASKHDKEVIEQIKSAQKKVFSYPSLGFSFLPFNVAVTTGNLLFKRKLFDDVGGFKDLKLCHDWDFCLNLLLFAEPEYIEDELYSYRIHGENTFKSLNDVAKKETEIVLGNYFSKMNLAIRERNYKRPSDIIWGKYMKYFVKNCSLGKYYNIQVV